MPSYKEFLRDPRFAGLRSGMASGALGNGGGLGFRRVGWPLRMAVLTGLLVAVLPLLAVILLAFGAGAVVYACCAMMQSVGQLLGLGTAASGQEVDAHVGDGVKRENVRVMPRS